MLSFPFVIFPEHIIVEHILEPLGRGELYVNYFEVFNSGLHSRRYCIQYQYPVKIWNGLFPKANELINISISELFVNYC